MGEWRCLLNCACWHRLVIRKGRNVCRFCGVEIETCPCEAYRVPDGKCDLCQGSGWLALLRSSREKFLEYMARDVDRVILIEGEGW